MSDHRNNDGIKRPDHPARPDFETGRNWPEEGKIAFRIGRLPKAPRRRLEKVTARHVKVLHKQKERLKTARAQLAKERKDRKPALTYDPDGLPQRRSPLKNLLYQRVRKAEQRLADLKTQLRQELLDKLEKAERTHGLTVPSAARSVKTQPARNMPDRFRVAARGSYKTVFNRRGMSYKVPGKDGPDRGR